MLGTLCNIGVNCGAQATLPECGVLTTGSITMVDGSQLVGDQTFFRKPGGRIWQIVPQQRLGHNNVLIGQFVADTVSADLNNVGQCCGECP